jgi:hypothetical protein
MISVSVVEAGESLRQVLASLRTRAPERRSGAAAAGTITAGDASVLKIAEGRTEPRRPAEMPATYEISTQQVAGMVTDGYGAERQVWEPGIHGDTKFVVMVAAYRVTPLAAGIYRVGSTGYQEVPVATEAPLASLRLTYGAASGILLICADPHQRSRLPGGCSYGSLLVRAGTLAYGIQLSAMSMGVPCSVYGSSSYYASLAARAWDKCYRNLLSVAVGTAMEARQQAANGGG